MGARASSPAERGRVWPQCGGGTRRVVVSGRLKEAAGRAGLACSLLEAEGRRIELPTRFPPAKEALEWHREKVFGG